MRRFPRKTKLNLPNEHSRIKWWILGIVATIISGVVIFVSQDIYKAINPIKHFVSFLNSNDNPKTFIDKPFDPQKINILVADFTDYQRVVDETGRQWAFKTFNELDEFMRTDPSLREVVEVKRLYSDSIRSQVRNEEDAQKIGEQLNADMVIWGQNLCVQDSICYYAKALIRHDAQVISTIEEGVLHQTQLLRADLPTLIGARASVLVKFIIGWTYLNDNHYMQFQQALKYLKLALNEIDNNDRYTILTWAGNAAGYAGEFEQGILWYNELEKYQKEFYDLKGLANTYHNIAEIYHQKGDLNKALEYALLSQGTFLKIQDSLGLASVYNGLGIIYGEKGDEEIALNFFRKSEKIFAKFNKSPMLANTYFLIGTSYKKKGDIQLALEFFKKSENILLETGDRKGLAYLYNNIAVVYSFFDESNMAEQYFQTSIQLALELGNLVLENTVRFNLAQNYASEKHYHKAFTQLQRCVEIDDKLNLPYKEEHLKWIETFQQKSKRNIPKKITESE